MARVYLACDISLEIILISNIGLELSEATGFVYARRRCRVRSTGSLGLSERWVFRSVFLIRGLRQLALACSSDIIFPVVSHI